MLPDVFYKNPEKGAWDTERVHQSIADEDKAQSQRTTERMIEQSGLLPDVMLPLETRDAMGRKPRTLVAERLEAQARKKRRQVLVLQARHHDQGGVVLMANDLRKGRRWCFVDDLDNAQALEDALIRLVNGRTTLLWPNGEAAAALTNLLSNPGDSFIDLEDGTHVLLSLAAFPEVPVTSTTPTGRYTPGDTMTHLDRLEAESMHIIREVMAAAENPVMLYSVGKDSSVMLHLARKAFFPGPPPFPLMHVDTRWKFQAMYQFRDQMARDIGMDLIVHVNPEGVERNINPFDHGSALHTDIMKTQGLKQALDQYGFDVAFGGARRDEEKSRAKERVFSFRNENHRWDPKNQRPELWNLYNGFKKKGESVRVFPLSNWTELDIWQYIFREDIPIVPLYFAADRPVVERDGMLIMVDDERMPLFPDEEIQVRRVRFRTLGCYPLTGAVDSDATDLSSIVLELLQSKTSERQGRAIDSDSSGSMEKKKQEGYF